MPNRFTHARKRNDSGLYYGRDEDGLPVEWIGRMKNALATLTPQFSSDRMVTDYLASIYNSG